jgi:two-component system chemotaxis response regulator CheY
MSVHHLPVLLVDDMKPMRQLLRELLRKMGLDDLDEAETGKAALHHLEKRRYALIIADWDMPEMDGLELLKRVRAEPEWKDTPFLMVTGDGNRRHVIEAITAGVNDYVLKPLKPGHFAAKVRHCLSLSPGDDADKAPGGE